MAEPCKKCGGTDLLPNGNCRACKKAYNKKYRADRKKAEGKPKKVAKVKKVKAAKAAKAPAAAAADLVIDACFGLTASLDGDYLKIEQSDAEGHVDTLMLSRTDMRLILERYGKWAE